ncbi:lipopolysaccharide biosynthesis protein [Rubrivivax gelatinosus]|nr:lipopolysaccharide biosynthesis protein [Rubrivivax gelatinosus]
MSEDLRTYSEVPGRSDAEEDPGVGLFDVLAVLKPHLRLLLLGPLAAGAVALSGSYLIPPTFTAKTTFLPPQQQQSAASAALSQLGALAGLAGAGAIKSPADQYVALMQSETVSDRIVEKFGLMKAYKAKYRFEARKELAENVRITVGKKDGLIVLEADDHNPEQAAAMANEYVAELRRMTNELALTEAQQRRAFFEQQLKSTRDLLTQAQQQLQTSGFNPGALKAEPKAAAETYARLNAELTAAEVRLQTLRRSLADNAPEVQQQLATLAALRSQLSKVEASGRSGSADSADYIGKYRDFKYQETLFDLFSRQYEMARLDESREGALIQVVDVAQVPEWKSKPKRAQIAVAAAFLAFFAMAVIIVWRGLKPGATRRPT